jgi:DNA-binding transcriptional ArsR family regulator
MAGIQRLTRQVAEVLEVLLDARVNNDNPDERKLYGYELTERTGLSGPSVYRILDRLEDMHLVTAWWEPVTEDEDLGRPRRRYYVLNDDGIGMAHEAMRRYPPRRKRPREIRIPSGQPVPGTVPGTPLPGTTAPGTTAPGFTEHLR